MNRGAEIDMRTGRPIEEARKDEAAAVQRDEQVRLRERAQFLELMDSEEGAKLSGIVWRKFVDRAKIIIGNDPECAAYMQVLKEFGVKIKMAESAANELAEKALRNR